MERRAFVRLGLTSLAGAAGHRAVPLFAQAPAIVTADARRPQMPCGVASGDVSDGRAMLWSRCDRPARLVVEYATTASFSDARRIVGPSALEEWDYTVRLALTDLPAGQTIHYRASFQDLGDLETMSVPVEGRFNTPPDAASMRDVTLAWSADTVGQGWGIDLARGGLRMYDTMRRAEPDLFVHVGDTCYADNPLSAEVTLDDGSVWRNVVTPEKSKVAETLNEFRGQYRYNLLDEHLRRFNASVPTMAFWDDHEVLNNFYDTRSLQDDTRYTEKRIAVLIARAKRAFLDFHPITINADDPERVYRACRCGPLLEVIGWDMRSYRTPNSANRETSMAEAAILGRPQLEWVKQRLATSRATWKVVASDMPIGLVVGDGPDRYEAVANGDNGAPLGRELEIADLLSFIRRERIRNVVFITGDVHYAAAHRYDPARARVADFDPFWEFVAGPIHAGTFGPGTLDMTFGPEAKFIGIPQGMKQNQPPSAGFQFFGTIRVRARDQVATVSLVNVAGETIYTVDLPPR